jgi:PLP dependent protein
VIDLALLDQLTEQVARNLAVLRSRIAASTANPEAVSIVAVTKGFGPEAPLAAMRNGLVMLGENYADELVAKAAAVSGASELAHGHLPEWHFQGRLQSNKINRLRPVVRVWQSVDSIERIDALAKRVPGAVVCLQVRLTDDDERGGATPEAVADLVRHATEAGLDVKGLMGVGPDPARAGTAASDPAFALLDELCRVNGLGWRSMGMSSDLESAVAHGATHVRIGTALFGQR